MVIILNKKKFRKDLFIHLDGIALTAPLSCIFNTDNEILKFLKNSNEFIIDSEKLNSINADYLNVTLRLFESQGWLRRQIIQKKLIKLQTTESGIEIFNQSYLYNMFFLFFPYLINLNFNNNDSYKKLKQLLDKFDELEKNTKNKTILKHIEGLIIGPILVALGMNKDSKVESNNELIFNDSINNENKKCILRVFEKFKLSKDN